MLAERLSDEKLVLKKLEAHYSDAMSEIEKRIALLLGRQDADLPNVINRIAYQRMLKAQVQSSLDKLHGHEYESIESYLQSSYTNSFVGTMYSLHGHGMPFILPVNQDTVIKAISIDSKLSESLYNTLGADLAKLKRTIVAEITRGIASGLMYGEMQRNIANTARIPLARARTIVRTEGGRVQEQATFDVAQSVKKQGADVVKQWSAILDLRTRPVHRLLDGQIREMDEYFEAAGLQARYPHDFGTPEEDCNCRCTLLIRARAALDAEELKNMQERASFFGLNAKDSKAYGQAKAKDFSDFKKKYLKAAESVDNSGKSGIIQVKKFSVKDAVSSGAVTTKINAAKQGRHIKTSKAYIEGRSYINGTLEDAQRLVDDLSGTGDSLTDENGNWLHKERVQADHVFGIHVDWETGKETETSKGMIIYSRTGTHIIPRKENDE